MNFEVYTTIHFERNTERLEKKHRNIRKDILPLMDNLENGTIEGVPIQGLDFVIYKTRVKSRDLQKGKSGGYRVIYLLDKQAQEIHLLSVYIKSEKETMSVTEIKNLLKDYQKIKSKN